MEDAVIIGGGPIGCYLAGKLAESGLSVSIYEEHSTLGWPVQCTGILTSSITNYMQVSEEFIVNRMSQAQIFSPNGKSISLSLNDIVVDRVKFDTYLANLAVKKGAKLFLNHKFENVSGRFLKIRDDNTKKKITVSAKYIIGADGPQSQIAKAFGLYGKRRFYTGMQAIVKGKFESNTFKVFLGSEFPDFFAWVVPENENIARVGVACKKNPSVPFKRLISRLNIRRDDILANQGGLIPILEKNLKLECNWQKSRVFIVGDAALMVKATTGGGIVPGIAAASILADCIISGKDYSKEAKGIRKQLNMHQRLRTILDKFSDEDYNKLVEVLSKKSSLTQFSKYTRDQPLKLFLNILVRNPKLLFFGKKLF